MKWNRNAAFVLIVSASAAALLYAGLSRETRAEQIAETGDGWLPAYGGSISRNAFDLLRDTASDFLKGLIQKPVPDVMTNLYATAYPLEKDRQAPFTDEVKAHIDLMGRPALFHFVTLRALENTRRYYVMNFLSYHRDNGVTAWRFEFVRVKDDWKISNVAYDSINPYEFIARPQPNVP